jgi:hypothetical protein
VHCTPQVKLSVFSVAPSPSLPPDQQDPDKQKGVEELLGPLAADKFAQIVALGKRITDWVSRASSVAMCRCLLEQHA